MTTEVSDPNGWSSALEALTGPLLAVNTLQGEFKNLRTEVSGEVNTIKTTVSMQIEQMRQQNEQTRREHIETMSSAKKILWAILTMSLTGTISLLIQVGRYQAEFEHLQQEQRMTSQALQRLEQRTHD